MGVRWVTTTGVFRGLRYVFPSTVPDPIRRKQRGFDLNKDTIMLSYDDTRLPSGRRLRNKFSAAANVLLLLHRYVSQMYLTQFNPSQCNPFMFIRLIYFMLSLFDLGPPAVVSTLTRFGLQPSICKSRPCCVIVMFIDVSRTSFVISKSKAATQSRGTKTPMIPLLY